MKFPEQACFGYSCWPESSKRGTTTHKTKHTQQTWYFSRSGKNSRRGNMTEILSPHTLTCIYKVPWDKLTWWAWPCSWPHCPWRSSSLTSWRFFTEIPQKSLCFSLLLLLRLCLPHPAAPTLLSSPFGSSQTHSNVHTHIYVSTVFRAGGSSQSC